MHEDIEQAIKEKLLESLIENMSDRDGDRIKPKEMAVQVAAPNKDKLAEGLDHAKDALGSLPDGVESEPSEDDDEHRLLQLLSQNDDDEDELGKR